MVICIDLDGVLANFTKAYGKLLIDVTKRDLLPKGWQEDDDWITTWYWERQLGYTKEEEEKVWKTRIYTSSTFWKNLDPLPTAVECMKVLNTLSKDHEVIYITHRAGKQAKRQSEEFLYKHGIHYPTVLLSGDKAPLLNALKAGLFIDDKASTIVDVAAKCKIKHLFLKDAAYNRDVNLPNVIRVPHIQAALEVAGLWPKGKE